MINHPISGYTGIFSTPILDPVRFGPTIYTLSDSVRNEAFFILLTKGCAPDAIKIMENIGIQNVKIFVPSIDTDVLTDLTTIIPKIYSLKLGTRWVYPKVIINSRTTMIDNLQIRKDFLQNRADSRISVEYVLSNTDTPTYYDIIVRDGAFTKYFCQYLNEEKLLTLFSNPAINEIHVTYSTPIYGGLSYLDAIQISKKYISKLYAHSFITEDEYDAAKNTGVKAGPFIH